MSDAQGLLDRDVRLTLAPAATRRVGADLLVNHGGATGPVRRLDGVGPQLWAAFADDQTIAQAAASMTERTGASGPDVERVVRTFATELVRAGLAEAT